MTRAILIVEDEPIIRIDYETIVTEAGFGASPSIEGYRICKAVQITRSTRKQRSTDAISDWVDALGRASARTTSLAASGPSVIAVVSDPHPAPRVHGIV